MAMKTPAAFESHDNEGEEEDPLNIDLFDKLPETTLLDGYSDGDDLPELDEEDLAFDEEMLASLEAEIPVEESAQRAGEVKKKSRMSMISLAPAEAEYFVKIWEDAKGSVYKTMKRLDLNHPLFKNVKSEAVRRTKLRRILESIRYSGTVEHQRRISGAGQQDRNWITTREQNVRLLKLMLEHHADFEEVVKAYGEALIPGATIDDKVIKVKRRWNVLRKGAHKEDQAMVRQIAEDAKSHARMKRSQAMIREHEGRRYKLQLSHEEAEVYVKVWEEAGGNWRDMLSALDENHPLSKLNRPYKDKQEKLRRIMLWIETSGAIEHQERIKKIPKRYKWRLSDEDVERFVQLLVYHRMNYEKVVNAFGLEDVPGRTLEEKIDQAKIKWHYLKRMGVDKFPELIYQALQLDQPGSVAVHRMALVSNSGMMEAPASVFKLPHEEYPVFGLQYPSSPAAAATSEMPSYRVVPLNPTRESAPILSIGQSQKVPYIVQTLDGLTGTHKNLDSLVNALLDRLIKLKYATSFLHISEVASEENVLSVEKPRSSVWQDTSVKTLLERLFTLVRQSFGMSKRISVVIT
jgi:hypothetical protein